MRAIKIDVAQQKIYEVDMLEGLDAMYEQTECENLTLPYVYYNEDGLYVDDEALLKDVKDIPGAFAIQGFPHQAFIGHGLIQGADHFGEPCDAKSKLQEIIDTTVFLTREEMEQEYERLRNKPFEIHAW